MRKKNQKHDYVNQLPVAVLNQMFWTYVTGLHTDFPQESRLQFSDVQIITWHSVITTSNIFHCSVTNKLGYSAFQHTLLLHSELFQLSQQPTIQLKSQSIPVKWNYWQLELQVTNIIIHINQSGYKETANTSASQSSSLGGCTYLTWSFVECALS